MFTPPAYRFIIGKESVRAKKFQEGILDEGYLIQTVCDKIAFVWERISISFNEKDWVYFMRDFFDILQVPGDASDQAIKQAYNRMKRKFPAKQYPERSRDIEEAYQTLCDPVSKTACLEFHHMGSASKIAYYDAQQSIIDNRASDAAKMLEKVLDEEQHKDHLYYLLGIAYMNDEKPRKAVKAFEQVVGKYPDDIYLKIYFSKACLNAKQYRKAVESAKFGYELGKDNFLAVYCLVEGYIQTKKYDEAVIVLMEALENLKFQERRYNICAKLSYILFLSKRFEESLRYMEVLIDQYTDESEILESGAMFLEILDFYIDSQMYIEASRCAGIILKLLPERSDIADLKSNIETILRLEPEYSKFDEDDFIPDALKALIANEIFPDASMDMNPEHIKAYAVLTEYQILNDFSSYLMAVRYMENKYPNLYELKKDFLSSIQVAKERKKLINKSKALFYQYQSVIEDMMEEWSDEYDEDEYDEDGYDDESGDDDED